MQNEIIASQRKLRGDTVIMPLLRLISMVAIEIVVIVECVVLWIFVKRIF